ncbi:MAG: hypothetical protein Q8N96_15045 [Methylovulum sp.]|nr:hypothetical protein [Methylovulum sp.]
MKRTYFFTSIVSWLLMTVVGIDKQGVPAWAQGAVNGFKGFDCNAGITRQVKYLIVRELTAQVSRDVIV